MLFGGLALLVVFVFVETKVAEPLFRISLFRIRAFAARQHRQPDAGAMGRGGMQFMLIIWLQGIWLPLHGYSYSQTPLWAGIYLIPLTVGFLVSGPIVGHPGGPVRRQGDRHLGLVAVGRVASCCSTRCR